MCEKLDRQGVLTNPLQLAKLALTFDMSLSEVCRNISAAALISVTGDWLYDAITSYKTEQQVLQEASELTTYWRPETPEEWALARERARNWIGDVPGVNGRTVRSILIDGYPLDAPTPETMFPSQADIDRTSRRLIEWERNRETSKRRTHTQRQEQKASSRLF